jgi:hypothetical protein
VVKKEAEEPAEFESQVGIQVEPVNHEIIYRSNTPIFHVKYRTNANGNNGLVDDYRAIFTWIVYSYPSPTNGWC